MALARKGKKGWCSDGSEFFSQNLKGKMESLKKNLGALSKSGGPLSFPGVSCTSRSSTTAFQAENAEGARILVGKVRAALNRRFQNEARKPDVLFVDRGPGFFNTGNGKITPAFHEALQENSLTSIMGEDASTQPGNLQEVLLHETAVSWMRVHLCETTPVKSWLETRSEYGSRLKRCCEEINNANDVESLCNAFPKRIRKLREEEGRRLKW